MILKASSHGIRVGADYAPSPASEDAVTEANRDVQAPRMVTSATMGTMKRRSWLMV
ncbi:hypothetical protein Krad_2511 [Kineococcus radiotolerans SRS30216 = ATCC BAA-149]|uniref:Uncharacterized protein n=1 Tax=Kineococcus radiotolerans (strain ATCC BAA-149 / DSM 14245 / SRS30216) TaxID=266940 RepID=A6WAZ7_KINRD|nr:hypothetical protein Krad_2511 [Kineococcus radiotolerans SRS30216 = ATCC BAA-149]